MPFGAYENSKTDEIKRNFYPVKGTTRKENTPEFRRVLEDYTARSINELTVTKDSLIVVEIVKNDHLIGRIALTSLKGSVPLRCLSKPLEGVNNEEEAYRLNYQLTEGLKNLKAKNSLKRENKNSEEENIDSRESRTFVQDPKFWPEEDDFDSDHSFTTEENTDEVVKGEEIQIRQNLQQISRNSNLTHQIIGRIISNCSSAKEGAFIKWTKGEYVSIIETEFVLPHFYKVRRRRSPFDEGQILKRNVIILQELSEQSWYLEGVSREECVSLLLRENVKPSTFIVKESLSRKGEYLICAKRSNNEIKYKRVIRSPEGFSLTGTVHFQTLVEVIDFHSNESLPQHLKFGIPFNKFIQSKNNPTNSTNLNSATLTDRSNEVQTTNFPNFSEYSNPPKNESISIMMKRQMSASASNSSKSVMRNSTTHSGTEKINLLDKLEDLYCVFKIKLDKSYSSNCTSRSLSLDRKNNCEAAELQILAKSLEDIQERYKQLLISSLPVQTPHTIKFDKGNFVASPVLKSFAQNTNPPSLLSHRENFQANCAQQHEIFQPQFVKLPGSYNNDINSQISTPKIFLNNSHVNSPEFSSLSKFSDPGKSSLGNDTALSSRPIAPLSVRFSNTEKLKINSCEDPTKQNDMHESNVMISPILSPTIQNRYPFPASGEWQRESHNTPLKSSTSPSDDQLVRSRFYPDTSVLQTASNPCLGPNLRSDFSDRQNSNKSQGNSFPSNEITNLIHQNASPVTSTLKQSPLRLNPDCSHGNAVNTVTSTTGDTISPTNNNKISNLSTLETMQSTKEDHTTNISEHEVEKPKGIVSAFIRKFSFQNNESSEEKKDKQLKGQKDKQSKKPKDTTEDEEFKRRISFQWKVEPKDITWDTLIGSGYYGEVWKGKWKGFKEYVAIKTFKTEHMSSKESHKEAEAMMRLRHPNLVKLFGLSFDKDSAFIVMEFQEKGSVLDYISNGADLTSRQLKDIAKQVASGMDYLGQSNFIHRDLSARNVLLDDNLVAKIADFGLSRNLQDLNLEDEDDIKMPWKWTAPEAFENPPKWSTYSDVWSYGIFLWEIYSGGEQPFENIRSRECLMEYLRRGERLAKPMKCSEKIHKDIMLKCWILAPQLRISFKNIKLKLS